MASEQNDERDLPEDQASQAVQSPWDTVDAAEPEVAPDAVGAGKPLIALGMDEPVDRDAASREADQSAARGVADQTPAAPEPEPFLTLPLRPSTLDHTPAGATASVDDDQSALRIRPEAPVATRGGGWTLVALCAGIAIIACCLVIPQTDANRRLAWEREKLKLDLEAVRKQVAVNTEFLQKLPDDPTLAERLAQRQMRMVRQGSSVLRLKHDPTNAEMNPFLLTAVAAPVPIAPYHSPQGFLSDLFLNGKSRLYATGAGLMLVAAGLVLGYAPKRE